MFASGKVVVTDRLHGSILAFLMNKPHVYIDQIYQKIRHTRDVAFNHSEACQRKDLLKYDQAENLQDAVDKVIQLFF